ncbi:MAG: ATP-binding cassette domain-containing protein [Oscillospiraceae bacterium]|nr:ATP-binding cassette domain-containing protein [Oscillospiraceae bacterium]
MTVTNLKKSFGDRLIVDLPSLTINHGDVFALWGRNGYGKSTFLRLLAGVLPCDEGRIQDRMSISYQPQNPYIFKCDCLSSVMLGSKSKDRKRAIELLDYFGLSDRLDVRARALSGGQRQCMFLARSLLTEGELLLLDEPFSAIDAIRCDDIAQFTLDTCKNQGRTLMVVIHKREHLEIFGHKQLLFNETGKIMLVE